MKITSGERGCIVASSVLCEYQLTVYFGQHNFSESKNEGETFKLAAEIIDDVQRHG
jgi:hypothetical protein